MTRAEALEKMKRGIACHYFSEPKTCENCRQSKPRAGGNHRPGSTPYRKGPWWCADCLELHGG